MYDTDDKTADPAPENDSTGVVPLNHTDRNDNNDGTSADGQSNSLQDENGMDENSSQQQRPESLSFKNDDSNDVSIRQQDVSGQGSAELLCWQLLNKSAWGNNKIELPQLECLLDTVIGSLQNIQNEQEDNCRLFEATYHHFKLFLDGSFESFSEQMDPTIHEQMIKIHFKLIQVIVLCLKNVYFNFLHLLSLLFSTSNRLSLICCDNINLKETGYTDDSGPEPGRPNILIVKLMNYFTHLGGFEKLCECFQEPNLNAYLIFMYLEPFSDSHRFLSHDTLETYFVPILQCTLRYFEQLSDEEFKKELKCSENQNQFIANIFRYSKKIALKMFKMELAKSFEFLKLKLTLRVLQLSSFSGKMGALNELNQATNVYMNGMNNVDHGSLVTANELAQWLIENDVMEIILKDCLHQPQYVEKLDNIIRFLLKQDALTSACLNKIWNCQLGKHEIIVKNIHELIAKLAWNFSVSQLNHLFVCIKSSWFNATPKEREKLLELVGKLAEDDQDGSMADNVLTLLWNVAYNDDNEIDNDIVEQALHAHLKILGNNNRDSLKFKWLERCINEIHRCVYGNNVVTALRQIWEICLLFPGRAMHSSMLPDISHDSSMSKVFESTVLQPGSGNISRRKHLMDMNSKYRLVSMLTENLSDYMLWKRRCMPSDNPMTVAEGRRFSHYQELHERLKFFKFFLQESEVWLLAADANEIWNCLAVNAIFPCDRQLCFRWFHSLMDGPEPDLDPDIHLDFFNNHIVKLNPALVDKYGVSCFEIFFLTVNQKAEKLVENGNERYLMEDPDLIGLDYLWKLILFSEDSAAAQAIDLLKMLYTNLGKIDIPAVDLHRDVINTCFDRLRASYDTVSIIEEDKTKESETRIELIKMTRVLSFLNQYIATCDRDFRHERIFLPVSKSYRDRRITIEIDAHYNRQNEKFEIKTHSNETFASIKKIILNKLKVPEDSDIEFCFEDVKKLDLSDPSMVISQISALPKIKLTAHVITNELLDFNIGENQYEEEEQCLPGVIISNESRYTEFLFQVSDLAASIDYHPVRFWCILLLRSIPAATHCVELIKKFCSSQNLQSHQIDEFEQSMLSSPTKTVYLLEILYSLLLPANYSSLASENCRQFQASFILSRYCFRILSYLKMKTFLAKAGSDFKILAWFIILKINKFTLTVFACFSLLSNYFTDASTKEALKLIPNDSILRNFAIGLAQEISLRMERPNLVTFCRELHAILDDHLVESVLTITWQTATGNYNFSSETDLSVVHDYLVKMYNDTGRENSVSLDVFNVCDESIEFGTVVFMLAPAEAELLVSDKKWHNFLIAMLILCPEESIRTAFTEQFTLVLTKCIRNGTILEKTIDLLFELLRDFAPNRCVSSQFFQFFCNLLRYVFDQKISLLIIQDLLNHELEILHRAKSIFDANDETDEILLEGHLKIAKELLSFLNPRYKVNLGCLPYKPDESDSGCVELLMDQYLFTASKWLCRYKEDNVQTASCSSSDDIDPICSSPKTLIAAYDLVVAFCNGCPQNLSTVCRKLETYLDMFSIETWEYNPIMKVRSAQGFVGLKNAGATCYMNSVLQQLFMIPEVRNGILAVPVDSSYKLEDSNDETFFGPHMSLVDAKTYNVRILQEVQIIFGHLLFSKFQYFVPKGFWQNFKLYGGPINIREQHDALEFFNSLFDSLDEALKALGQDPIMSNVFGGLFSDQKICKDCPHRYCCEESFTTLNVDILNHRSMKDSLEQYVRGDLLEGENAYYCEKCDRKVNTVKRLCIKKLPKVLVIQLKRFDFDYEQEVPIKSCAYFEFPRDLDMEPYTVDGLALKEGEIIEENLSSDRDNNVTRYELTGIVVHSGQASGGHYYSFIRHETADGQKKWYKFDDIDVSQCNLDDDDEMKSQCFGGDLRLDTIVDPLTKSPRLQKRWWTAFILFYRKVIVEPKAAPDPLVMPLAIKKNVQHQNTLWLHQKTLFSEEFYHFMRSLLECNIENLQNDQIDVKSIAAETLRLAAKFLFSFCFRSKKTLRGSHAVSWYELTLPYLKLDQKLRNQFINDRLLAYPNVFKEFLLECPSTDVRMAFSKLLAYLSCDALLENDMSGTCADEIMGQLVNLLFTVVPENLKQSAQYFDFFYMYATNGSRERRHLLTFNVPLLFMKFASETIANVQFYDAKLYQVVSILVRSFDTAILKFPKGESRPTNPYKGEDTFPLVFFSREMFEFSFTKEHYLEKIIKDGLSLEENVKLILFFCWEEQQFSWSALKQLLTRINNAFSYELVPYFRLLSQILLMDDSLQELRIQFALVGDTHPTIAGLTPEMFSRNQRGLFGIMTSHKGQFDKKAFHCSQMVATLLEQCALAVQLFRNDVHLRSQWIAVREELKKWSAFQQNFGRPSSEMSEKVRNWLRIADEIIVPEPSQKQADEEPVKAELNNNKNHPATDLSAVSDCTVMMDKVMNISHDDAGDHHHRKS